MNRLILVSNALLLSLLSVSFTRAPHNYLESLVMLKGTDYRRLNCSRYICTAKHHRNCGAKGFWEHGCDGDALIVEDVASFDDVDTSKLLPGDVAAFHGAHVGVFVGKGVWMDSDFKHNGVGIMTPTHKDSWFCGRVRILRWKNP